MESLYIIIGVVVLAVVAAAGYFVFFRKKEDPEISVYATTSSTSASPAATGYESVVLTFSDISLKPVDSEVIKFTLPTSKEIDLLATGANLTSIIEDKVVPAGKYEWIRLLLTDKNYLVKDGVTHNFDVPSGSTSGLKLIQGFVMPESGSANFGVDFQVDKSIVKRGDGTYHMKPVLKLIDNYDPNTAV